MKILILLFLIIYFTACSNTNKNEQYYQTKLCNKLDGVMEYKLEDKTRVDCLTDKYAIEVEWAKKWAEGIGQSLYYAHMTDKKAGIALITSSKDERFINRVKRVAKKFNIKIFIIKK